MERKANSQVPSASTLWLAIGVGGFSVLASFCMAIYFASVSTNAESTAMDAQTLEVSASSAD